MFLSSPVPVSPTQSMVSTLSPVPGAISTSAPLATPTPLSENKLKRLKVFLSPYFCAAILLIFLGLWLVERERQKGNRAGHSHNKFVK
jgi:hypothetical protein